MNMQLHAFLPYVVFTPNKIYATYPPGSGESSHASFFDSLANKANDYTDEKNLNFEISRGVGISEEYDLEDVIFYGHPGGSGNLDNYGNLSPLITSNESETHFVFVEELYQWDSSTSEYKQSPGITFIIPGGATEFSKTLIVIPRAPIPSGSNPNDEILFIHEMLHRAGVSEHSTTPGNIMVNNADNNDRDITTAQKNLLRDFYDGV